MSRTMAMLEQCTVVICIFQVSSSRELNVICYQHKYSAVCSVWTCCEFKNRPAVVIEMHFGGVYSSF